MSGHDCQSPISPIRFLEYWLGELSAEDEGEVEAHYLGCSRCTGTLEALADLGISVKSLVREGRIGSVVSAGILEKLTREGLHVREYRVPLNGSVQCTVAPGDDVLVSRLEAPVGVSGRMDLVSEEGAGRVAARWEDIPFDASSGEVIVVQPIDRIRLWPATTFRLQLVAVGDTGDRRIGTYTFHHSPADPAG